MREKACSHPAFLRSSLPQAADLIVLHYNSAIRVAQARLLLLQRPPAIRLHHLPFIVASSRA
jgi:hypothetical protein